MKSAEYCNNKIGNYYNALKPVVEEAEDEKGCLNSLENTVYIAESETSL